MTLAVSAEDLGAIRTRVKEFNRKLLEQFPSSNAPRAQLVAVNVQMLTLTQETPPTNPESPPEGDSR